MHLDREPVTHIKELQQQRETRKASSRFSQHLFRKLFKQLSNGLPFKHSAGDEAGMVLAVTEYPCFADRAVAGQRSGEQVRQTSSAPEPILINRFEAKGIQRYLIHDIDAIILVPCANARCIRHGGPMRLLNSVGSWEFSIFFGGFI